MLSPAIASRVPGDNQPAAWCSLDARNSLPKAMGIIECGIGLRNHCYMG